MNAARLLADFDRLAEAPDAVPRLRGFILDLAVRGKLVGQDARDEPATELLKQIRSEKAQLVKAGLARKSEDLPEATSEEQPFQIPASWCWVRLGNVINKLTDGTHHSPVNVPDGDFKYITAKNIKSRGVSLVGVTYVTAKVHSDIFARCNPEKGDILYVKDGATTGVVTINDLAEPFSMLSSVALLKPPKELFNRLLVEFLRSPFFFEQMRGFMKGAAIPRVTLKRMGPALLPLPPISEQHRIVAKIDELMALCDQLEAVQKERERRRDCLVSASLQRLNQPADTTSPGTRREHARFHLQHLPRLASRAEHVKALRHSILNLAATGTLVNQDLNDEPVALLLARISGKRTNSCKSRKGGADKRAGEPPENVNPFGLPAGWAWMRMDDAARPGQLITYGILKPVWVSDGIPTVRVTEMKSGVIDVERLPRCDPVRAAKFRKTTLEVGDLLISKDGTIGKTAFVPQGLEGGNITQHVIRFPISNELNRHYVRICIDAPFCQRWLGGETKGVALQGVNVGDFRRMPLPIPPLREQSRIVAKVDELMALCDQLEAQVTTARSVSRRLLEAVLDRAISEEA